MDIKIKYHDKDLPRLHKFEYGDWIDLYTSEEITLKAGEFKIIPLGISVEMPKGYELNIVPRSSTYKNFKILQTNCFGVVDNTYCGDNDIIGFPAICLEDVNIPKYSKICQCRINKTMHEELGEINFHEVDYLGNEDRGGFGSTGIK